MFIFAESSTLSFTAQSSGLDHQRQCFGVYRVIGQYNGAPLYQQDRGDYFIYLQKGKVWQRSTIKTGGEVN